MRRTEKKEKKREQRWKERSGGRGRKAVSCVCGPAGAKKASKGKKKKSRIKPLPRVRREGKKEGKSDPGNREWFLPQRERSKETKVKKRNERQPRMKEGAPRRKEVCACVGVWWLSGSSGRMCGMDENIQNTARRKGRERAARQNEVKCGRCE